MRAETLPARQAPSSVHARSRRCRTSVCTFYSFNRALRIVTTFGYGCASETPIELPVVGPVAELGGHWEVDYARSDTVQTQINASFREVQREIRRRQEAVERGASPQGMPLGDLDTLIALAKMAELVTDSDLLEIEQDPHILRVERANNFALSCDLDEVRWFIACLALSGAGGMDSSGTSWCASRMGCRSSIVSRYLRTHGR